MILLPLSMIFSPEPGVYVAQYTKTHHLVQFLPYSSVLTDAKWAILYSWLTDLTEYIQMLGRLYRSYL